MPGLARGFLATVWMLLTMLIAWLTPAQAEGASAQAVDTAAAAAGATAIRPSELKLGKEIGTGSYGVVYVDRCCSWEGGHTHSLTRLHPVLCCVCAACPCG